MANKLIIGNLGSSIGVRFAQPSFDTDDDDAKMLVTDNGRLVSVLEQGIFHFELHSSEDNSPQSNSPEIFPNKYVNIAFTQTYDFRPLVIATFVNLNVRGSSNLMTLPSQADQRLSGSSIYRFYLLSHANKFQILHGLGVPETVKFDIYYTVFDMPIQGDTYA